MAGREMAALRNQSDAALTGRTIAVAVSSLLTIVLATRKWRVSVTGSSTCARLPALILDQRSPVPAARCKLRLKFTAA
jgi:hypothetical protein